MSLVYENWLGFLPTKQSDLSTKLSGEGVDKDLKQINQIHRIQIRFFPQILLPYAAGAASNVFSNTDYVLPAASHITGSRCKGLSIIKRCETEFIHQLPIFRGFSYVLNRTSFCFSAQYASN